jgi:dTDP-4-dehydrorhamnose 3,5-epimerase-like enzyme
MHIQPTHLPGAALIEPERREDERGWFARVFCEREFSKTARTKPEPCLSAKRAPSRLPITLARARASA